MRIMYIMVNHAHIYTGIHSLAAATGPKHAPLAPYNPNRP